MVLGVVGHAAAYLRGVLGILRLKGFGVRGYKPLFFLLLARGGGEVGEVCLQGGLGLWRRGPGWMPRGMFMKGCRCCVCGQIIPQREALCSAMSPKSAAGDEGLGNSVTMGKDGSHSSLSPFKPYNPKHHTASTRNSKPLIMKPTGQAPLSTCLPQQGLGCLRVVAQRMGLGLGLGFRVHGLGFRV